MIVVVVAVLKTAQIFLIVVLAGVLARFIFNRVSYRCHSLVLAAEVLAR